MTEVKEKSKYKEKCRNSRVNETIACFRTITKVKKMKSFKIKRKWRLKKKFERKTQRMKAGKVDPTCWYWSAWGTKPKPGNGSNIKTYSSTHCSWNKHTDLKIHIERIHFGSHNINSERSASEQVVKFLDFKKIYIYIPWVVKQNDSVIYMWNKIRLSSKLLTATLYHKIK